MTFDHVRHSIVKHGVLVVGNYLPDQQESMIRFASLLERIYALNGQVILRSPCAYTSRIPGLPAFARKYFAYIDKLLLFPLSLLLQAHSFDLVHIADHSNAFYAFCIPRGRCIVTCHDLLAVRAAMGDASASCDSSPFGIWLQWLIMAGLRRASAVVFDSQATFQDFQRIIGTPPRQRHAVIPIPLNAPFSPDYQAFPLSAAEKNQLPQQPYLLMVGSALPRKNRAMAQQLLELLGTNSPYHIVLAGAAFTPTEQAFHHNHPLGSRLLSIPRPSHALLNRLYCQAHALLFPSFAEGFGWPLVEAQTCCCPVIATPTTSIPEVAGDGALYADPTDVARFAEHVRTLEEPTERARLIKLGLMNTRRYNKEVVAEAYRRFAFHT
jgi:glycosyltransferase involved in cell wall biosynthesis